MGLWEKIDALAVTRVWQPGEVIYREGEPTQVVHIVRSGQIDLNFSTQNGSAKPLRRATRGEILSLGEAVGARGQSATATARSRCETGFLLVTRLRALLDETPGVWFSVLQRLSQDVTQSWDSLRAGR